jgi:opacity protein-like surface antigen
MSVRWGASTLVLAAFAMGGQALAADIRVPTKAPVYTKAPPPACAAYWTLFGGWNHAESMTFSHSNFTNNPRTVRFDDGYVVGGAVGHCIPSVPWLRVEGELSYRRNGVQDVTVATEGTSPRTGSISALAFMVNAWADFHPAPNFTLHAGGGVGVAHIRLNVSNLSGDPATPTPFNDSDTVFAFQLGVGGAWHFRPNYALTLDYRYFHAVDPTFNGIFDPTGAALPVSVKDDYRAHSIMVGLRGKFGY